MFHIGDRVVSTVEESTHCGVLRIGDTGTVVEENPLGVCWDRNIGGHDLCGNCEPGYGWYMCDFDIKLIECDIAFETGQTAIDGLFS